MEARAGEGGPALEAEAEADRRALLDEKGDDPNKSEVAIARIHSRLESEHEEHSH
jgi:hypothetical protein